MAREISHSSMPYSPDTLYSATRYQIAEQLRYIGAILEMLEAGTWSAAAGMQLNDRLHVVDATARQMGWSALQLALADLRKELSACVQHDRAPDPAAKTVLQAAIDQMLASNRSFVTRDGSCGAPLSDPPSRHMEVPS